MKTTLNIQTAAADQGCLDASIHVILCPGISISVEKLTSFIHNS